MFGEAARLSVRERADVLAAVRDAVGLPLVVGATSLSTAPLLDEVEQAAAVAGDRLAAVMVQVNSAAAGGAARAPVGGARRDRRRRRRAGLPAGQRCAIGADELADAVGELPFVAAVKAESPPTSVSVGTLARRLDVPVFGGLGGIGLLDELAAGAAGAMTGYSFPEGLLACVSAWHDGGFTAARDALAPHLPLIAFEQQPGIGLALRKACLQRRGLLDGAAVRPPSPGAPPALAEQLARHVDALAGAVAGAVAGVVEGVR